MSADEGVSREPDRCRSVTVDVDGEAVPVQVRGSGEWDDDDQAALAEVVRATIRHVGRTRTLIPLPSSDVISREIRELVPDRSTRRRVATTVIRLLRQDTPRVEPDHSGGDHLLRKHAEAFVAAERDPSGALRFSNGYSTEWMAPGQWLLAAEWCSEFHHFQTTGDPCWCGSDNCAYCARCGMESHD